MNRTPRQLITALATSILSERITSSVGLLGLEGVLAGISFLAYLTLHEQKDKGIKKIEKRRLEQVRLKLATLIKENADSKEITKETEDKFEDLFDKDYTQAYEPSRTLRQMDRSFLLSGVLFAICAIVDLAESSTYIALPPGGSLLPVEIEFFIFGSVLLGVGIFELERLRRMSDQEPDLDPAPLGATVVFGLIFATDAYFLYVTITAISSLTLLGRALFISAFLPFAGIILVITTWEEEDWRRALGEVFLFAPYITIVLWILGSLIASTLHIG